MRMVLVVGGALQTTFSINQILDAHCDIHQSLPFQFFFHFGVLLILHIQFCCTKFFTRGIIDKKICKFFLFCQSRLFTSKLSWSRYVGQVNTVPAFYKSFAFIVTYMFSPHICAHQKNWHFKHFFIVLILIYLNYSYGLFFLLHLYYICNFLQSLFLIPKFIQSFCYSIFL